MKTQRFFIVTLIALGLTTFAQAQGWRDNRPNNHQNPPVVVVPTPVPNSYPTGYNHSYRQDRIYQNGFSEGYEDGFRAGAKDWRRGRHFNNGRNSFRGGNAFKVGYNDGYWQGYEDAFHRRDHQRFGFDYNHGRRP